MSSGSGPQAVTVTAVALPASTAETVIATVGPCSWANAGQLGNLLSLSVLLTGAASGNVTIRVRQGTTITGAQVGTSMVQPVTNGPVAFPCMAFADTSAFATGAQSGASYTLTAQGSVNSAGTLTSATLSLETMAPVE